MIPAKKAEKLLDDLANEDSAGEFRRLSKYHDVLPASAEVLNALHQVQPLLRKAWDAPDLWHFEWYSWAAEMVFHQCATSVPAIQKELDRQAAKDPKTVPFVELDATEGVTSLWLDIVGPPETPGPIHAVFFHFRHNRARALHCPNANCKSPYFFATKKGQKYCSTICTLPSQPESKRLWWKFNRGSGKTKRSKVS